MANCPGLAETTDNQQILIKGINVRSSAGHLAKQSGALGSLRRSHSSRSVLLRRSSHGGRRAALLRRGSRDGGARRSASGRALTRHGDGSFCGVEEQKKTGMW